MFKHEWSPIQVPVGIGDIEAGDDDHSVWAKIQYLDLGVVRIKIVLHGAYPLHWLFGKQYDEAVIANWIAAHSGLWNADRFLLDKLGELVSTSGHRPSAA
jgi:hypothetical protein